MFVRFYSFGFAHATQQSEEVVGSSKTTSEEEEKSIEHLMETPGLELTRAELESLFDLAEEDQDNGGDRDSSSKSGGSAQAQRRLEGAGGNASEGFRHQRSLTSGSSLLLFLQRCGQRRSE